MNFSAVGNTSRSHLSIRYDLVGLIYAYIRNEIKDFTYVYLQGMRIEWTDFKLVTKEGIQNDVVHETKGRVHISYKVFEHTLELWISHGIVPPRYNNHFKFYDSHSKYFEDLDVHGIVAQRSKRYSMSCEGDIPPWKPSLHHMEAWVSHDMTVVRFPHIILRDAHFNYQGLKMDFFKQGKKVTLKGINVTHSLLAVNKRESIHTSPKVKEVLESTWEMKTSQDPTPKGCDSAADFYDSSMHTLKARTSQDITQRRSDNTSEIYSSYLKMKEVQRHSMIA